jgi:hypothetical protein
MMTDSKKSLSRRDFLRLAGVAAGAAAAAGVTLPAGAAPFAGRKTKIDTPSISCVSSTQSSITVMVCAPSGTGATGLPAGFSVQWVTKAALDANLGIWPPTDGVSACGASFSGNANLSRYNLLPGECVTVNIGELLFDEGASTNCPQALVCGTDYVFRVFGHATNTLNRSDFSVNVLCSTLACFVDIGCTYTQGYWKNHNPTVCLTDPESPLCIEWPVTSLTLGTVAYDVGQLLSILNTSASGNGLISLAHQLIAAKLNIANGADGSSVAADIASADAVIGGQVVPPVGSGYLAPGDTSGLVTTLTAFNEGTLTVPHCA